MGWDLIAPGLATIVGGNKNSSVSYQQVYILLTALNLTDILPQLNISHLVYGTSVQLDHTHMCVHTHENDIIFLSQNYTRS